MEIEKVIRILTLFLFVLVFALHIASRLMFPEARHVWSLPLVLCLLPAISASFRKKEPNCKKHDDTK